MIPYWAVGRRPVVLLAAMLCAVWTVACGSNTPTSPTATPSFSHSDLRTGAGDEAASGKTLTVTYTGWLYDASKADLKGLQFDSSTGRTPFTFVLGQGQVIAGWDQGLVGMKVGGLRRLVIPPSLAYGQIRNASIPPYSTLVFDVELIALE